MSWWSELVGRPVFTGAGLETPSSWRRQALEEEAHLEPRARRQGPARIETPCADISGGVGA